MKKIIYSLFVFLNLLVLNVNAQTFWFEGFGAGACNNGNLANGAIPTGSNGAWAVTALGGTVTNGVNANEWFISATEQGALVGACSGGCGGPDDNTLHLGPNFIPNVDIGAEYLSGALNETHKRAESPVINTTGKSNIQLSFEYTQEGVIGNDYAEVWYFDGTWKFLAVIPPSAANGGCGPPNGRYSFIAFGLPPSCNNILNLRIGFRWQNNDLAGALPGITIDDIELSEMTINMQTTIPCPQQTVSATVGNNASGVTGYTWTSIPTTVVFTPTTTIPTTVQFPAAGVYTIILLGSTLPNGIPSATAISVVTVNLSLPIAASPPQTVCPTSNATVSATGATTYTWNVTTNTNPVIGNASSVIVTCPTSSVVNYVVQGTQGMCISNTILTTVTYTNIGFNIPILPANPTVCPGTTVGLTASGATSYTWITPSSTILNGAAITDTPAATGVYTVSGDNGGCIGTGTVLVTVQNIPVSMTLTPSSPTLCMGQTVTINAIGATNYTWTPPATLSSSVGAVVNASPTITTTYNVLGEFNGCTGNTQITITVTPGPNLNVNLTANAVCAGYTSTMTASGAMSYTWTGTTFTGSINQPSISMGPGIYTVVASSTAFVCPSIKAITISSMSPLVIGATQSSFTTCISSNSPKYALPVVLNANGGSTYNWAPCVGGYLSICLGNSVIARPQTTTQYTVTGYTSVCSGSAVITVTVVPQSTINVQPPQPIACLGGCFNFTVSNTNTTLPIPYTYSWSVPNPVPLSVDNILSPTVVACPSVSATYTVEMRDFRNCVTEPRLVSTTIIPQPLTSPQTPTINGIPTNSVCFVGDIVDITTNTLTLCANNLNVGLLAGVVPTYTWYATSVPSNSLMNDGSIKTPTSSPCIIISPVTKLPAQFTYTVRSSFNGNGNGDGITGCFAEDTVSVRIVDCRRVAEVTFTTAVFNDTICTKQCVTFTNTTDAGDPMSLEWTFPGGAPGTSTLQVPTVCYNLPGEWNVILKVSNPYGAPVQKGKFRFIKVVDVPNTTIVPPGMTMSDTTIRFGMSVALTGTGAVGYSWGPPYMISKLTGNSTVVSPHQTTQYILTGYNSLGCSSNDTINVIVIEDCGEMFVPNAFSPNDQDNIENETLKVYGYCLETMTFQVFNRWGQKVWETTDQTKGWDGTFSPDGVSTGDKLNSGVFVYRLEGKDYNGKGYSMKGNVTLIR